MKKVIIYPFLVGVALIIVDKILPLTINNTTMIPAITLHDIIPVLGYAAIMGYYLNALRKRDNKHKLIVRYYKSVATYPQGGENWPGFTEAFGKLYSDKELKTLGFKGDEIDLIRTTGSSVFMMETVRRYERLLN
jgi:hypothetical protein